MKPVTAATATIAMAATLGGGLSDYCPAGPKAWKPEFTEEELAYVRLLRGKAKRDAVAALRQKYLEAWRRSMDGHRR